MGGSGKGSEHSQIHGTRMANFVHKPIIRYDSQEMWLGTAGPSACEGPCACLPRTWGVAGGFCVWGSRRFAEDKQ